MKAIKIIDIQKICNGCKFNLPSLCDKSMQDIVSCEEGKEDASTIEQVPETFEELKELCKKLEPKLVKENNLYETQITLNINGGYYAFYSDGTIIFKASNSINYTIAKNRTMLQMFQFIKSILGEE